MDRRSFALCGMAAASTVLAPAVVVAAECGKAPVVLVHGSWHGAWCWQRVTNRLAERGHRVAAPDLAAHGLNAMAPGQVKTMDEYVAPAVDAIKAMNEPVILVGHSLGGVSVGYICERHPTLVRHAVYLAAFLLPPGKKAREYVATDPSRLNEAKLVSPTPDGPKLDASDPAKVKDVFYADCSDGDVRFALANLIAVNPAPPYALIADISAARGGGVPRSYIHTEDDHVITVAAQRKMIADMDAAMGGRATRVVAIKTSHSPFFSDADELSGLIDGAR